MRLMRTLVVMMALVSCNHENAAVDAAIPADAVRIDAKPDAPPVALDCPSYCTEIQANCKSANAQYSDAAHCSSACKSFVVGASQVTDSSGNTLGCRIYHAGTPSMTDPGTHCVHAGPGGDLITAVAPAFCSGGDVCASFCALEIMACGTQMEPLPGMPRDGDNNPLYQYQNLADCMSQCSKFDKTHAYSTTAVGDSLACRMFQATEAAIAVTPDGAAHCSETSPFTRGVCAGTAMP
jgi:hypothetical protein